MNVKWFVKYATKFSQHQGWQWPNESIVSGVAPVGLTVCYHLRFAPPPRDILLNVHIVSGVAPVGLTMCVTTSGLLLHHETSS